MLQQGLALLLGEHIGVADEALLQPLATAHQEVQPPVGRQRPGDFADELAEGEGDFVVPLHLQGLFVDVVAPKDFVGALAGEHHLQVLAGQVAHKVQGHRRGVRQGLVHVVLDFPKVAPEFLGGDDVADVLHRDLLRKLLGVADFVVLGAVVKAHGEGLVHMGRAGHIAAVHAGGQERAHLHVGNLVGLHAVVKGLLNFVHPVLQALVLLGLEGGNPVPGQLHLAVLVFEVVPLGHLVHVFKEGLRPGGVLEGEVVLQGLLVELLHKVGVMEEALDLRAKQQRAVHLGVVQGLDAEEVPGAKELTLLLVPDDKGEHAPQLV